MRPNNMTTLEKLECGPMHIVIDGRPVEYMWHPLFSAAKFG